MNNKQISAQDVELIASALIAGLDAPVAMAVLDGASEESLRKLFELQDLSDVATAKHEAVEAHYLQAAEAAQLDQSDEAKASLKMAENALETAAQLMDEVFTMLESARNFVVASSKAAFWTM